MKLAPENTREGWPILLADVRNVASAGSTSDTTGLLLNALVEDRVKNCVMADLYDVYAVEEAHPAGIGSEFSCELSGKFGGLDIPAFRGIFKVATLSDGRFDYQGEIMRGVMANIVATAALELLPRLWPGVHLLEELVYT